jgi:hypothetical protein
MTLGVKWSQVQILSARPCLKLTDIVDSSGFHSLGDLHERTAAAADAGALGTSLGPR